MSPLLILVKSLSYVYPRGNGISAFAYWLRPNQAALDGRAVCGCLIAGLAGSNPLCLLLYKYRRVRRGDSSSRGRCVCMSVCDLDTSKRGARDPIWVLAPQVKREHRNYSKP